MMLGIVEPVREWFRSHVIYSGFLVSTAAAERSQTIDSQDAQTGRISPFSGDIYRHCSSCFETGCSYPDRGLYYLLLSSPPPLSWLSLEYGLHRFACDMPAPPSASVILMACFTLRPHVPFSTRLLLKRRTWRSRWIEHIFPDSFIILAMPSGRHFRLEAYDQAGRSTASR